MDQPYTKENIEAAMEYVRKLLEGVNALETMFPGRHFTLDGHLVGSVGEVAAAYYYAIELFPPSTECHDGKAGDRNVQIKITQTDNVLIGEAPDYLIVLYLTKTGNIYEVYNGPGAIPWESGGKPDKRGYKHLRVNKLMNLDKGINQDDRISAVHPIEKLTPALKNIRKTNLNTGAKRNLSKRALTDDEKTDIAAVQVLEKYRPAFEELAK